MKRMSRFQRGLRKLIAYDSSRQVVKLLWSRRKLSSFLFEDIVAIELYLIASSG